MIINRSHRLSATSNLFHNERIQYYFLFKMLIILLICISCVYCGELGLPEGSSCSWNGIAGKCVKEYRCLSYGNDLAERDNILIRYLAEQHPIPPTCSTDGKTAIVCCTDCELVDDTRLLVFDQALGILKKSGTSKAKDKCLDYIKKLYYPCKLKIPIKSTKILDVKRNCTKFEQHTPPRPPGGSIAGGYVAEKDEYPHMALLGFGDTQETAKWLCGGTVISERFILTAGHCIGSLEGPVKFIRVGFLKRSDPSEPWQHYSVKRIIPYPAYDPSSKYHDIALLETDREIEFRPEIHPACLHVDGEMDHIANVTGWGNLGSKGQLADTLQVAKVQQLSKDQCFKQFPQYRQLREGYNHSTQACYGDHQASEIATDTCPGDSGGPLQSVNHEQCVHTIIGVTSFGRKCGKKGGAGMYTRVSYYVPWIENIVWP